MSRPVSTVRRPIPRDYGSHLDDHLTPNAAIALLVSLSVVALAALLAAAQCLGGCW